MDDPVGVAVDVPVDVVVWRAPGPASLPEAAARYAELRSSPLGAFDTAVAAFVRSLVGEFSDVHLEFVPGARWAFRATTAPCAEADMP